MQNIYATQLERDLLPFFKWVVSLTLQIWHILKGSCKQGFPSSSKNRSSDTIAILQYAIWAFSRCLSESCIALAFSTRNLGNPMASGSASIRRSVSSLSYKGVLSWLNTLAKPEECLYTKRSLSWCLLQLAIFILAVIYSIIAMYKPVAVTPSLALSKENNCMTCKSIQHVRTSA